MRARPGNRRPSGTTPTQRGSAEATRTVSSWVLRTTTATRARARARRPHPARVTRNVPRRAPATPGRDTVSCTRPATPPIPPPSAGPDSSVTAEPIAAWRPARRTRTAIPPTTAARKPGAGATRRCATRGRARTAAPGIARGPSATWTTSSKPPEAAPTSRAWIGRGWWRTGSGF